MVIIFNLFDNKEILGIVPTKMSGQIGLLHSDYCGVTAAYVKNNIYTMFSTNRIRKKRPV